MISNTVCPTKLVICWMVLKDLVWAYRSWTGVVDMAFLMMLSVWKHQNASLLDSMDSKSLFRLSVDSYTYNGWIWVDADQSCFRCPGPQRAPFQGPSGQGALLAKWGNLRKEFPLLSLLILIIVNVSVQMDGWQPHRKAQNRAEHCFPLNWHPCRTSSATLSNSPLRI